MLFNYIAVQGAKNKTLTCCVNVNIIPPKITFKQYAQNGGHEIWQANDATDVSNSIFLR